MPEQSKMTAWVCCLQPLPQVRQVHSAGMPFSSKLRPRNAEIFWDSKEVDLSQGRKLTGRIWPWHVRFWHHLHNIIIFSGFRCGHRLQFYCACPLCALAARLAAIPAQHAWVLKSVA
jgi:hypothetical protein